MKKKPKGYYLNIFIIWFFFSFLMSLAALDRILETYTYILYSFVLLYILYVYIQVNR